MLLIELFYLLKMILKLWMQTEKLWRKNGLLPIEYLFENQLFDIRKASKDYLSLRFLYFVDYLSFSPLCDNSTRCRISHFHPIPIGANFPVISMSNIYVAASAYTDCARLIWLTLFLYIEYFVIAWYNLLDFRVTCLLR